MAGRAHPLKADKVLHLLPIGDLDDGLAKDLRSALERCFRLSCKALPVRLDPEFAFHPERQQYHSSEILHRMQSFATKDCVRVLGITPVDLYIPILSFVFGEAQMGGPCALVSTYRLTQEFYGLGGDRDLLRVRLIKEAVHELGHTFNLTHCDDYSCVMASSHAVEWIDLKERSFCDTCQRQALTNVDQIRKPRRSMFSLLSRQ